MFNRSQVIPEAISIPIIPIIPIAQLSSVLRVEVLSRSLWGASQQAAAHGRARPQTQRLHNVAWAADAAIGQDGNAIDAPEKSLRPQLPTKEGPSWEVATEPPWALSRGLLKPYCLEGYGGKDAWNRLHDHWSNVKHDFIVIFLTQTPKAYCWCPWNEGISKPGNGSNSWNPLELRRFMIPFIWYERVWLIPYPKVISPFW